MKTTTNLSIGPVTVEGTHEDGDPSVGLQSYWADATATKADGTVIDFWDLSVIDQDALQCALDDAAGRALEAVMAGFDEEDFDARR